MKALIAAGGSGTRLRPLTFSSNKHLLPIANKPLLLYPIEAIAETGIAEVGVIVNQTRPAVEALLGDGKAWGLKITYIEQLSPAGLAHVVQISKDYLAGDSFVYHLGDNIFTQGILRPFNHFQKTKPDALLTMVKHEENFRLGVPYFDEDGKLIKVVEKPENPPNQFGVPGLYFFSNRVFEAFEGKDKIKPSARGELEITDLYTYLLEHGARVETEEVDGRWMDPGKFDDMLEANRYLLDLKKGFQKESEIDETSRIEGEVSLGKNSVVKNSTLKGPVAIGDNVTLENVMVGPNVSIDSGCVIKNVAITNSIVMQNSDLENIQCPVVDSLIGKNTKVFEEHQPTVSLFIGDHCTVRLT